MNRRYQPELDGLRGLSVALVVAFHLGFSWMPGGYVGVSVFFTLSGYLITRLLLDESARSRRVDLRRFYARRARRLLPAAQLTLMAVVVARVAGEFRYVDGLETDLWGALAQVANWVQLAGTSSYASLFATSAVSVSPVAHFWSLAIEEQFYLVWPLALLVLVRRRSTVGISRPLAVAWGVAVVVAFGIAAHWGRDAAYWATPARFAELLAGAWLAAWQHDRHRNGRGTPVGIAPWGWPALAVVVAAAVTWPSDGGPAYSGWLSVFSVATVVLVASLQVPGAIGRVFASRPLAWWGRISYGVYLLHWPVFAVARAHGRVLTDPLVAVAVVAIVGALAHLSFVLLERPIRTADWEPSRTAVLAIVALAVTAAAISVMPRSESLVGSADPGVTLASLAAVTDETLAPLVPASSSPDTTPDSTLDTGERTTTTVSGAVLPLPDAPARPMRVVVVGDSTAFAMGRGLAAWAAQHPDHAAVDVLWAQGLGFVLDGRITSFDAASFVERSAEVVRTEMPSLVARVRPDVVVLMTTVDDVADRQWTADEGPLAPTDPRFGARLRSQYRAATRLALAAGAPRVVWVVAPVPTSVFDTPDLNVRASHLAVHEAIREVAASEPGVAVAEMDGWMTAAGVADDDGWRPDGTHLSESAALRLATDWFGPWLLAEVLRPLP